MGSMFKQGIHLSAVHTCVLEQRVMALIQLEFLMVPLGLKLGLRLC